MIARRLTALCLVSVAVTCALTAIGLPSPLYAQFDYGWRDSANAGGAAPGEGGGTMRRGTPEFVSFYADRLLGGALTLEDSLTATGKIDWENDLDFDGDIFFGFFNPSEYGLGGTNSPNNVLGLHVREQGGGFSGQRVFAALFDGMQEYATNYVATPANGFNEPFDRDFDFLIDYDPGAGANGRLTVDLLESGVSALQGGALVYDLSSQERANGATFTAFGVHQGENSNDLNERVDMFFDDLQYTVFGGMETQTFDSAESALAAGWIAFNAVDPLPSPPPPLPPPDVNQDTMIDLLDFAVIRDNFRTGTAFEQGDVNFDGTVSIADFARWKQAAFAAVGDPASVPEPATLVLLVYGVAGLFVRPRR